jgi:hypothetical protein
MSRVGADVKTYSELAQAVSHSGGISLFVAS